MATLQPGFTFTGTLGNMSAYKMRGSDKIILRTKGGPSKDKIKTSPQFERTRENNSEFGGRAKASSWVKRMLHPVSVLADHNIINSLNPPMKKLQQLDTDNPRGKRNVCLEKAPQILEGFSLNKRNSFDTIVRGQMKCSIDRVALSAAWEVPGVIPGINFFAPVKQPMFRMVMALGAVPAIVFTDDEYAPVGDYSMVYPKHVYTQWQPVLQGCDAQLLELTLPTPPGNEYSLVLSVGVCFGTIANGGVVQQVKYGGAGKVVLVR